MPNKPQSLFTQAFTELRRGRQKLDQFVRESWFSALGSRTGEDIKRLDRIPNLNEFGYDSFGFQPEFTKLIVPIFAWIYRNYFRVKVYNIDRIPAGRCLLVANHSGQIPLDGLMIGSATLLDGNPPRFVRTMIERWIPSLPFVSIFFSRLGQVVGTPENCQRLLEKEEMILVFPEGSRGISKEFRQRYQLESFGQGFMRLALANNTPIVPIAVVGAEEQAMSLYNFEPLARLLNMPSLPITPTFPLLGPLGLLPLPVRYHIHFGEPIHLSGDANDEEDVIGEKVEIIRSTIQRMLYRGLKQRKGLFR